MYQVYLVTNKVNNKKYVGITKRDVKIRIKEHFSIQKSNERNTKFTNAILKYGKENFVVQILEDNIPDELAEEKEIYYIKQYDSYKNGYNSTEGGNGTVGYIFTNEVREKMSNSWNREKIITPERNKKISNALKGRKLTEEHKQKLRDNWKEYYKTHDNHFKGKKHSEESKNKMRENSYKYSVEMLDKNTEELLKTFNTVNDACIWIKETQNRKTPLGTIYFRITIFMRGKCKDGSHAIYGYKWRYIPRVRCND